MQHRDLIPVMNGSCFVSPFLNQGSIDFYDQHLKGKILQL